MKKKTFWILFALLIIFAAPAVLAQGEEPPIAVGAISAVRILAFVAAGTALLLDYFPPIASRYNALEGWKKRLIAVGIAVAIVGGLFALTCFKVISTDLACTGQGAYDTLTSVILVIIGQYGFHEATKPTESLKDKIGVT